MNISDTLLALDPEDDGQWTVDGHPRMDSIAKLVPHDPDMTRKQIIDAFPDFNRDLARKLAAERAQESSTPEPGTLSEGDEATQYLPGDTSPETKPELIGDGTGTVLDPVPEPEPDPVPVPTHKQPTTLEGLQVNLAAKTVLMNEAYVVSEKAKTEADGLADAVNALNREIEVLIRIDPNVATAGIRAYIAQQNLNRQQRGAGMRKFLADTGLNPKDVHTLTSPQTPLDRAMAQRKTNPQNKRPVHPRMANR